MPSHQLMHDSDADASGEANLRPRRLVGDAVYVLQRQVMSLILPRGLTEEQIANDPSADLIIRPIVLNTRTTGQRIPTMQFEYPILELQRYPPPVPAWRFGIMGLAGLRQVRPLAPVSPKTASRGSS